MYDVAIIGAGTMGMAAGFYLAREGKKVALIDKHDPPHSEGAHHGESRLMRRAHFDKHTYTPLATRAHALFKELEAFSNENIYITNGMLCFGPHGSDYVHGLINAAEENHVLYDFLTGEEINERWPGFNLPDDFEGYLELDTGILLSEKVISTYKRLASENGADFYMNENIHSIETDEGTVFVDLGDHTIEAKKLIITGGKMVNEILQHIDMEVPIEVLRKTFSWFDGEKELYKPDIFPSWTYVDNDGKIYYGFPNIESEGIKVGRHDGGRVINPHELMEPFGYFNDDQELGVTNFVQNNFSESTLNSKSGDVCTYAVTPDQDFIIDYVNDDKNIILACGFSGHAFKFSSAIGEILQFMATDETDSIEIDISKFKLSRFNE